MRPTLGIRGRLALSILLAAVLPLVAAIVFARSMVQQTAERFFVPEVRQNLDRALGMYGELARTTKLVMRQQVQSLASDPRLLNTVPAALSGDSAALERHFRRLVADHDNLVSLALEDASGERLAHAERSRAQDPDREHHLAVRWPLQAGALPSTTTVTADDAGADAGAEGKEAEAVERGDGGAGGPVLLVLLATDKARFDAFGQLGEFVDAYSRLEQRRESDERSYVLAFAALLGLTIASAIFVSTLVARGVLRRVSDLASATRQVAAGDLSIRVEEDSLDEIGDLGRGFNRMLSEVEGSRERIEFLSRLASWQEMARRLAHEIKNPLTPIQLAVQEVHQRLADLPPEQARLLDLALEIVESEVHVLRRLVGEFSEFARLPECRMEAADWFEFLREIEKESSVVGGFADAVTAGESDARLALEFALPDEPAQVFLDRQLMRRALVNLVRNAVQASRGRSEPVRVRFSAHRLEDFWELLIDDDGPGVPQALRSRIFEPYVSTKNDGTGLGLAIVKKVVIEHKGHIEMLESPLGGARVRLLLPLGGKSSTPQAQQLSAPH